MSPILLAQTLFSIAVAVTGALVACLVALLYFRHVRMERPAIGTFNARDLIVVSVFIIGLPVLYLLLPSWALTGFLILTFLASLSIGYKPLLPPVLLWGGIGTLIGLNIWLARTQLGTVTGWQAYWTLTSVIVLLGSVAVVNLYAQGGMRLQHVAFFAFGLAFYDAFFSMVIPLTPLLADAFQGHPLDPSIGMRTAFLSANIGIGDLLVYGLFTVVAFKAYGRPGARLAIGIVVLFGAVIPASAPLLISIVVRSGLNVVVPAQTFFGPAALLAYLWLRKLGPERTMTQFLATNDTPPNAAIRPAPTPTFPHSALHQASEPERTGKPGESAAPPRNTAKRTRTLEIENR
jgi:hypothetical protein